MRKRAAVFLAAAVAAAVISCASGPAPKTSQTEPAQTPPAQPAPEQAAPVASTPSQEAPAQASGSALALPKTPPARVSPEVDTAQTSVPDTQAFPLSAPQAPPQAPARPAKPAKPVTRAEKPKPRPAQPPAQAAAAQPGAAQSVAPQPGVQASAAPPTAGQPAAAQAGAPAGAQPGADATYGTLRQIFARPGDDVQIGLDGGGFLFLGFPDRSPDGDGMSFKGKDTRDGKTWFTFKALKLGTYDLDFLRQDNTTGTSSKETVRVHVVSDEDFAAAVAKGQDQGPASSAEPGDPAFAAKLTRLGQYDAAIAELLKGYRDGNPQLNDQIARLYLRTGAYDAAGKYFSKNLSQQGPLGDGAVLGLVQVAIAQKDQPGFLALLKRFLAVKDPGFEDALLAAMRFEKEKQEIGLGIDLASEYLSRYANGAWRDEADYTLAQLLESDSQFRDIARARATYQEILDRYPESAFAADARNRLGYIDRHFFNIR